MTSLLPLTYLSLVVWIHLLVIVTISSSTQGSATFVPHRRQQRNGISFVIPSSSRKKNLPSSSSYCRHHLLSFRGGGDENDNSNNNDEKTTITNCRDEIESRMKLAKSYLSGDDGIEKNETEAVRLFTLIVADNDDVADMKDLLVECYQKLGECYMVGLGVERPNPTNAIKYWTMAAEEGYIPSQICLGKCYMDGGIAGSTIEQDPQVAFRWYEKASSSSEENFANTTDDQIDTEFYRVAAWVQLGKCYAEGKGIEQNVSKALELWEMAGEKNNTEAQNKLSYIYFYGPEGQVQIDYTKAVYWMRKLVRTVEGQQQQSREEKDNTTILSSSIAWAYNNLAMCLVQGLGCNNNNEDTALNKKEAFRLFHSLASSDDTDYIAHGNVGCCYLYGEGVEHNLTSALQYLTHGAEGGSDDAQYNLGNYYSDYTNDTEEKAIYWWKQAAQQGYEDAKAKLQKKL